MRQLRQISYIFNQKKIENIFWRQFLHTPYSIRMYTTVQDWVQLYGNSSEQYTALFMILQVIIFAFFRVCHFFSIKFIFFTFYVYCWLKDIIIFLILPIVFFKLWRLREGTRWEKIIQQRGLVTKELKTEQTISLCPSWHN